MARITIEQRAVICRHLIEEEPQVYPSMYDRVFSLGCILVALESMIWALIQANVAEVVLFAYGMKCPMQYLGELDELTHTHRTSVSEVMEIYTLYEYTVCQRSRSRTLAHCTCTPCVRGYITWFSTLVEKTINW